MSGLEGKRMRPVPGLVDALGRKLVPRSGLPRIFLAVRPCRLRFGVIGAVLYDRRSTVSSELARTRGIRLSN